MLRTKTSPQGGAIAIKIHSPNTLTQKTMEYVILKIIKFVVLRTPILMQELNHLY